MVVMTLCGGDDTVVMMTLCGGDDTVCGDDTVWW